MLMDTKGSYAFPAMRSYPEATRGHAKEPVGFIGYCEFLGIRSYPEATRGHAKEPVRFIGYCEFLDIPGHSRLCEAIPKLSAGMPTGGNNAKRSIFTIVQITEPVYKRIP